ncbi:hypothetical protein ACWDCC_41610 [Streptomyces sp. NPDC001102]
MRGELPEQRVPQQPEEPSAGAVRGWWVLTGLGLFCFATGYAPFGRSRVPYDDA